MLPLARARGNAHRSEISLFRKTIATNIGSRGGLGGALPPQDHRKLQEGPGGPSPAGDPRRPPAPGRLQWLRSRHDRKVPRIYSSLAYARMISTPWVYPPFRVALVLHYKSSMLFIQGAIADVKQMPGRRHSFRTVIIFGVCFYIN